MKTWIRCLALLFASAIVAGCGDPASGPPTADKSEEMNLEQVAEMLREFQLNNGKPPKNLKELKANPGGALGGVELVASGAVVVPFGVTLPDTKEEPGGSPNEEVLAYGKDVPTQGGAVLLLNRTVRRMTADEFKAATLAMP
ncbi:hypothetical protein [Paludisphaera mucosa]|uniref:Uncharacterized protein n=1 Tax=Paludisphaera mucosa TaxID=3030827 RepID=A0ABT6FHA7_9BACT|nr:hypothetical protein [Paludisphaera mucosa]MDG3006919.1 hypothetical protein [Paludisphaera mucosa]